MELAVIIFLSAFVIAVTSIPFLGKDNIVEQEAEKVMMEEQKIIEQDLEKEA